MKRQSFKQTNSCPAILACALGLGFAAVPNLYAQTGGVFAQPGVSAIIPYTQQVEIGPILDVVPYVLSDGYTINLTLIPSLTDFNGYDTPPNIASVTGSLNVVQLPVILPNFTIKKNLMIFVTATIVDPAGNRVHSDDELPFAQSAIPEQPPGASTPSVT